ncbi:peptidoglycan-binding protein [Streptomyces sp. NPDC005551]|uniref:peptidoglycan-binding domain-containing protein n=1 Tax=Streptomyces sp. NPDC005551 TaxID=3364725 RepID=UPI00368CEF22
MGVALVAAAVLGFAVAVLLPGDDEARAARPTAPAAPSATSAAGAQRDDADPDGAGTLREGDSGPEVAELQERLLRIPDVYEDGPTDGSYDAALRAAVARFQQWYGIRGDETGVYGDDTRHELEARTTPTAK